MACPLPHFAVHAQALRISGVRRRWWRLRRSSRVGVFPLSVKGFRHPILHWNSCGVWVNSAAGSCIPLRGRVGPFLPRYPPL